MEKLSEAQKAANKRQRMIDAAKAHSPQKLRHSTAVVFQKMIRAECGAKPEGFEVTVESGVIVANWRHVGEVVCVTCGKIDVWSRPDSNGMQTGHFIAGRGPSTLFEPTNANPQCVHCNKTLSGNQSAYRLWMETVHGVEEIERLQRLKTQTRKFSIEELVDMKLEYSRRLNAAIERMKNLDDVSF